MIFKRLFALAVLLTMSWIMAQCPEYIWEAVVWLIVVSAAIMLVAAVVRLFRGG